MEKAKYRPDLSRPELVLPCNEVILPQQVAFEADNGTIFEMCLDRAEALGLLAIGQVAKLQITSEQWREIINQRNNKSP